MTATAVGPDSDVPNNQRIQELCSTGTPSEIRDALAVVIAAKLRIQAQLSVSKSDMAEVRGELLRHGADPRHAQVQATSSTDQDWRGRAVRAAMVMDSKIRRLKERQKVLNTGIAGPAAPGGSVRKAVAVSHRTLIELADFVQSWLDDGWSVMQSIPHADGVVLVLRDDTGSRRAA